MKKVKEKRELIWTLLDEGYLPDEDGNWIFSTTDSGFAREMFQYCGKDPGSYYYWKDSWLEEVDVDVPSMDIEGNSRSGNTCDFKEILTDEEIWNSIWRTGDYELLVRGHDPYHDMWLLPVRGWQHRSWFKNREHWRI